jgi:RNA polymerase sigma-70 factor (ECF subfamily)
MGAHEDRTDAELAAAVAAGDIAAFDHLLFRHGRRIQAIGGVKLPTGHAEDLVQEVFVALHIALVGGEEILNVRAWLNGVAHNKIVDFWRGRPGRAQEALEHGVALDEPTALTLPAEGGYRAAEFNLIVDSVLAGLSPVHAEVVRMRFLAGYSGAETARATGESEDNVYQIVRRFKLAMRALTTPEER